ncbi:MAG: alpha-mannosidase [Anaerolineaceae bacterium]|nr:alpha-mannosidase [Anaerolineaceae bacterium]
MQKHEQLSKRRLARFQDADNLAGLFYPQSAPVKLAVYHAPGRISYAEAMQGNYELLEVGYLFTPLWSTHWVRVDIQIPADWAGKEVHFRWDSTSEGQIWVDGKAMQGLSGSVHVGQPTGTIRSHYLLAEEAVGGETLTLYVEVACNHLWGVHPGTRAEENLGRLRMAEIAVFDRAAWDLYWDFKVIADMAIHLPSGTPRQGQALRVANQMVDLIRMDDPQTWRAARGLAEAFYAEKNGDDAHELSAIGNAHIDTGWLWVLAETKRKCYRTFSTAVRYMDQYPEYKFTVSQAQQLEWMKDEYPELYGRIQEKFAAGQLIPTGGAWVEPDCNLPSGESFVRQFLYGQRFFEKEFGFHCDDFWEPDVFGYSAALPQIMKLAEIDYFLTQKLSWNQFNKIDMHSFYWEGLDGTQVLTHFPPLATYIAYGSVEEVLRNVTNYKDHEKTRESYLLYGIGDGGGGPMVESIEQLSRMKDVAGLPKVTTRTPKEFFRRLEADLKDPVKWVGELYLEYHRGTYTTQAATKNGNRRSEFMLHEVEFLSALASLRGGAYPRAALDRMWKVILTNQFHDILPGSSITEVYEEAEEAYARVLAEGGELRQQALDLLFAPETEGANLLAVNPTGFDREEVVEMDGALQVVRVPAYGVFAGAPATEVESPVVLSETANGFVLENRHLKAVINRSGIVERLIEKASGREAIAPNGKANQFVLYEDRPIDYDAWDVDIYHLDARDDVPPAMTCAVLESTPLRAVLRFTYEVSERSTITQKVILDACARYLDFNTEVEWHEAHKFLKVEFPLEARAKEATYEIQFGHVERPTHYNTSWDMARFEVCAHRWADLSEYGFGVALLNDSKYGYATHDNVMRLSLLRAPKYPDPQADMGTHHFRYALMPHQGSFQEAGVIAAGYHYNEPLLLAKTNQTLPARSYFRVNDPAIVIDTVKRAEDSDDLIVRMYESFGARGEVRFSSTLDVDSAMVCNLLERQDAPLAWTDGGCTLSFKPFQIITLKLKLSA